MKEKYEGLVDHFVCNGMSLEEAIELLERAMIARTLEATAGNRCAASRLLGVHRNTLQRKIEQYELGEAPARKKQQSRAAARGKRRRTA